MKDNIDDRKEPLVTRKEFYAYEYSMVYTKLNLILYLIHYC